MAPHSSTVAWKIPWMEEPGRLQSMGSLRVGHHWATSLSTFHVLEKEMATHSSVLAWRIPGTENPGGLQSMGSHRVGHDWSDSSSMLGSWICIRNLTNRPPALLPWGRGVHLLFSLHFPFPSPFPSCRSPPIIGSLCVQLTVTWRAPWLFCGLLILSLIVWF